MMRVNDTAEIVVPDPLAPDPSVEGTSVQLVELTNIDASGRREWEVRAVKAGRAVVRGTGSFPFQVTFEVSA